MWRYALLGQAVLAAGAVVDEYDANGKFPKLRI
jgi:hypothetical protein